MITAELVLKNNLISSVTVSGHSGYAEEGADIVCAAVSSAVILTANTITEVIKLRADVAEGDGFMSVKLERAEAEKSREVMNGLRFHLERLSEQYGEYLKVKISEV